jgi:N-acyl-D-aspartate/D-glutamate deacylase
MAFYAFPLHLLRLVRRASLEGRHVMSIERAVHRLTGEVADFLGVDAGHLREGARADVVVVDPAALDERLDVYHEATMEGFGDLRRMVNRSDGAVDAVLIAGRVAFEHDEAEGARFHADLGRRTGFGAFLPARTAAPRAAGEARVAGRGPSAAAAERAA